MPSWLTAINAEPMKQGLDLRGGVHFLLEVDIDSVITRRYEGMMKSMGQDLREANIRYAGIRYITEKGINIYFRNEQALEDALSELRDKFPSLLFSSSKSTQALTATLSLLS